MNPLYLVRTIAVTVAAVSLIGCAQQYVQGTKIDKDTVSQIKKGVTTKAEVIATFGSPIHTGLMGDGRRMIAYSYFDTSSQVNGATYIPVVGLFAGGSTGKRRTQSLQIILNKNDVVEDYAFSDEEGATESRGGLMNMTVSSTPVAPQDK